MHSDARVLSLDCFDTLFWRHVAKPFDIFTLIDNGISPIDRAKAEARARARVRFSRNASEVTIDEIYAELDKQFTQQQRQALIEHEIKLESENGFLFEPAVALLRKAKERGVRTIIVSDIYYSASQLSRILEAQSPEILSLIDHIYCSAEFGYGKYDQLWPEIISQEEVAAQAIFHVGDNAVADYHRARSFGINAVHFLQNEEDTQRALSHREVIGSILLPECRSTRPVPSWFHSCYSTELRGEVSGDKMTAWTTLGPVLYAFARFIQHHCANLPGVKLAFLLRDGYMPYRAWQTLYPEHEACTLRISRLTSVRASFCDKSDIEAYLIDNFHYRGKRETPVNDAAIELVTRHFMLSPSHRQQLGEYVVRHGSTLGSFCDALLAEESVAEIIENSARIRERLIKHLRQQTGISAGETLVFIDLGYEGTTQNRLSAVLEKELDITVKGCYLIARFVAGWRENRFGLLNPDTVDYRTLSTLTQFIASFEMLCSSHDGTVVDYLENGEPVQEQAASHDWLIRLREIQDEALAFIRSAAGLDIPAGQPLWDAAAIELARHAYFPTGSEIQFQESTDFDFNLGTGMSVHSADTRDAGRYMRKFGLARLIKGEKSNLRANYASELRYFGPELAVALLSSSRYSLSWDVNSSTLRRQQLEVMFVHGDGAVMKNVTAFHSFDGFFSAYIPPATTELALMVGKTLRDMEIFSVALLPAGHLGQISENENSWPLQLNSHYFVEGGSVVNNLITNLSDDGFIYFNLKQMPEDAVLHIVYRPLLAKD